jgi:hypothetical protein
MNKFLQISTYAVGFLLALGVGNVFGSLISAEADQLKCEMPGRPLPLVLLFFIQNHFIVSYLFLFPWLGFVGLPLLPLVRGPYWDANLFLLRFSVFLTLEILLICFFSITCYSPFIWMSGGLAEVGPPPLTWAEASMRGLFWFSVLLLLISFTMRVLRARKLTA